MQTLPTRCPRAAAHETIVTGSVPPARRAFTLIELLAVLSITMVLAVIGMKLLFQLTETEQRQALRLYGGVQSARLERQWRDDVHHATSARWGRTTDDGTQPVGDDLDPPPQMLVLTQPDGSQVRYVCEPERVVRTETYESSDRHRHEEYRLPLGRGRFETDGTAETEGPDRANDRLLRFVWEEDPYPDGDVNADDLAGLPRKMTIIEALTSSAR